MKKIKISELNDYYALGDNVVNDIITASLGKHYLSDGAYFNVESYETTTKKDKRYESHKRYIDVQIIIEGKEIISVEDTKDLLVSESYDYDRDVMFYQGNNTGKDVVLEPGDALILMPQDGHMPGVSCNDENSCKVKKAVIKIPYTNNKTIKYLVMDVDGTLTDGKIYMGPSGEEMKAFNIKDGCGIHDILIPAGITPIIITGRKSDIVDNRARELGIKEVYQGQSDKLAKLQEVTTDLSCVAFIGDDINDLPCINAIKGAGGIIGSPANAIEHVKNVADYVAPHNGGDGAVRDFIEWIVKK